MRQSHTSQAILRGFCGGLANACAVIVASPLDVLKVRFQIQDQLTRTVNPSSHRSLLGGARQVIRDEGVLGLYKGLSASVLREMLLRGMTFAMYEPIRSFLDTALARPGESTVNKSSRVVAGLLAGVVSSGICSPTDLIKIRFQADKEGKRYSSLRNAFATVAREEGIVKGLYKSALTTMVRGSILASAQFASYDITKQTLLRRYSLNDHIGTHLAASVMSGVVTSLATSPVDVVRTRIMNEHDGVAGAVYCRNPIRVFVAIVLQEGPLGLYKGFVPAYVRTATCTAVSFVLVEQFRRLLGLPSF